MSAACKGAPTAARARAACYEGTVEQHLAATQCALLRGVMEAVSPLVLCAEGLQRQPVQGQPATRGLWSSPQRLRLPSCAGSGAPQHVSRICFDTASCLQRGSNGSLYKDSLPRGDSGAAPSGSECLPVQVQAHHKTTRTLRALALVQELHAHTGVPELSDCGTFAAR